jgi:hypothetical protein
MMLPMMLPMMNAADLPHALYVRFDHDHNAGCNAGERLSRDSDNASVLVCTWREQDAVVKLIQPQVVRNNWDFLTLQRLLADEAQQYTGRLAALQGTLPPLLSLAAS